MNTTEPPTEAHSIPAKPRPLIRRAKIARRRVRSRLAGSWTDHRRKLVFRVVLRIASLIFIAYYTRRLNDDPVKAKAVIMKLAKELADVLAQ